jgi:cytochrome bd ubiquinol oxidase subunit II
MATAWFWFLAAMITVYVVLDGFDLGVGALYLRLARTNDEREEASGAIGPIWNGNEVWLIAGGGVLFLAFPVAYAAAFSGLYFGLILVLWLLVGRGLALELRHQIDHPLWHTACDTVFCLCSAALAFVFGVALGNVVRGVPLDANEFFHLSLFQILNWYALLVGVFGLVVLCGHGAAFLALRTTGPLAERARRVAPPLAIASGVLAAVMIAPTQAVRSDLVSHLFDQPWRLVFPVLAIGAFVVMVLAQRRGEWARAFVASSLFIAGLLTTLAAGIYPYILPAREGEPHGLTAQAAASGSHALKAGLIWYPLGMALAVVYFVFAYRMFFRTATVRSTSAAIDQPSSG